MHPRTSIHNEGHCYSDIDGIVQGDKQKMLQELKVICTGLQSNATLTEKLQYIADQTLKMLTVDRCHIWIVKPGDCCHECAELSASLVKKCNEAGNRCLHAIAGASIVTESDFFYERLPLVGNVIGDIGAGVRPYYFSNEIAGDFELQRYHCQSEKTFKAISAHGVQVPHFDSAGVFTVFSSGNITAYQNKIVRSLAGSISQLVRIESGKDPGPASALGAQQEIIPSFPGYFDPVHGSVNHSGSIIPALQTAESQLSRLFQNVPFLITISSLETGQYIEVNNAFLKTFGFTRKQVLGVSPVELGVVSQEQFVDIQEKVKLHKSVEKITLKMKRSDDREVICQYSAEIITAEEGPLVLSSYHDMTESICDKIELFSQAESLNAIFNSTPSMLALVNGEGRIEKINRAAIIFTEKDEQQVLGKLGGQVFNCVHTQTYGTCGEREDCLYCPVRRQVEQTLRTGAAVREKEGRMTFILRGESIEKDLLISTVPLEVKDEVKVLLSLTDVTEFKEAQREKNVLKTQLLQAQKLESIGRLAGGVAHDLNNLLSPILGYSDILLDSMAADDPRTQHIKSIIYAGQRAGDLVRQLLAFSRKQKLDFKTVDVDSLLRNFKNLLRRTIREDIVIHLDTSHDAALVRADAGQLEQVIMNLAVNAQDAMPDGGTLSFTITRRHIIDTARVAYGDMNKGDYVVLSVVDTGCGMDAVTQKNIFEPFYTTKSLEEGTGLGLSTAYGIIKQHNGYIWVDSRENQGTAFEIFLPALDQKDSITNPEKIESFQNIRGSETILLVEDDEMLRELISGFLDSMGYSIIAAANGPEALSKIREVSADIDLLITDVIMPDMSGKELKEIVAAMYPDIKVLFMSGYSNDIVSRRTGLDEKNNFLAKPFSTKKLGIAIRDIITRQ